MNDRSIRVLELAKILEKVQRYAVCDESRMKITSLTPSSDHDYVRFMQAQLSEATSIIFQKGNIPLNYVYNLIHDVKVAQRGSILGPQSLVRISQTMRSARVLSSFLNSLEDFENKYPLLSGMIFNLKTFREYENEIENAIGSEYEILDSASPQLRDIRRKIEAKNAQIRHKLDGYLRSPEMQKMLQDMVITIKNDRFVLPVKSEYKSHVKGTVHDQSGSGSTFYIEPSAIVEMNNELSSLKVQENVEIERILSVLSGIVGDNADEFAANYRILVDFDVLNSKAKYALEINATEPEYTSEKYLKIRSGRHPLLSKDSVVPLNLEIGSDFTSLLITGPNTGGKTVSLKTVGLFCLMYQTGLHLPLEYGSKFTVFDHVLADIGDEQSIEQSLSTFSSHMTNIVDILGSVSSSSLVLLDELGAGTDPVEGAALAISILTELKRAGCICISTTHYSELKQFALTTDGYKNASVEFNVETLSPTYRLIIGLPGKSNAFEISKKLGLGDNIIKRAHNYLDIQSVEFEELLAAIEKDRRLAEDEKMKSESLRLEAEKYRNQYYEKLDKLSQMQSREVEKIKAQSKTILAQAKEEADRIVKELREMQANASIDNKRIESLRGNLRDTIKSTKFDSTASSEADKSYDKVDSVKIGDEVFVISLKQNGTVASLPDKSGALSVQVGILKMNTSMDNLALVEGVKKKQSSKTERSYQNVKRNNISMEIDLRGMDLEAATMELDKYIDDAFMAGLPQIRIIHGKGTGVLRAGVKEYLRTNRHVKTSRDGSYHEGGIGVTIAELK